MKRQRAALFGAMHAACLLLLLIVFNPFKEAVPPDVAGEALVFVEGEPYQQGTAYDVVFGYKAPVATVGGLMAVVAKHKVVVHFEGVAVGDLSVDVNLIVLYFEGVPFVGGDDALVQQEVVGIEGNGFAACGHFKGAVVVATPVEVSAVGEDLHAAVVGAGDVLLQALDEGVLSDFLGHRFGHGQEVVGTVAAFEAIVFGDAEALKEALVQTGAVGNQMVVVLQGLGVLDGFSVDVNLVVANLEEVAGQGYAAFYVVVAPVNGAVQYFTKAGFVVGDDGAAQFVDEHALFVFAVECFVAKQFGILGCLIVAEFAYAHVIIGVGLIKGYGVAGGEVENDDVVAFYFAKTFQPLIIPLGPFGVRLGIEYGKGVLHQGKGDGGIGHTGTVAYFTHKEVIAHQHGFFEGGSGDFVVLKQKEVDHVNGHQGKDQGVDPLDQRSEERRVGKECRSRWSPYH